MVIDNPKLLIQYYRGQLEDTLKSQVDKWLNDSPVNRLRYEEFIRIFSLGGLNPKQAWKKMWSRLYGRPSAVWLYISYVIWFVTLLIWVFVAK